MAGSHLRTLGLALALALMVGAPLAEARAECPLRRLLKRPPLGILVGAGEEGVAVRFVLPLSIGARLGLTRGDTILEAEGDAVKTPAELRAAMKSLKTGDTLHLVVRREDGWVDKLEVKLELKLPALPKLRRD